MKKYLCLLLVMVLTIVPVITFAKEEEKATKVELNDYTTLNFEGTLKDEEMELKYKDYKETDDQVVIYMFRGRGCGFCRSFLTFLNSISEEYGKYFKVVSFESWYDENNYKLLETLSKFLENPAGGVPYIIIGDQVFGGYSETYDESIKTAIMDEYNSDSRYDVIEEYNESLKHHMSDVTKAVLWNLFFVIIATTVVIVYVKKQNEKLLKAINERPANKVVERVKKEAKKVEKEVKKEVKKVVRKANAKKK